MNSIIKNIIRFFSLVLMQVLIVKHFNFGFLTNYISAIIYISFLFTLPHSISKYWVIILAFCLGLTVDVFSNTYGIHASACVFTAFLRPRLVESFNTDSIYKVDELTIFTQDRQKYIYYIFILTFAFFLWLFFLEEFSFTKIPIILLKTILSTIISSFLIILGQLLLFKKPN